MEEKINKILLDIKSNKISKYKGRYKISVLCGVFKNREERKDFSFKLWLESRNIKQIGGTLIYRKDKTSFYEEEIIKMYNKNKRF